MKWFIAFSLLIGAPLRGRGAESTLDIFRFHLISEPASLKPWEQRNSVASYLLSQISGTLLSYQDQKLSGNLAEKCVYKNPRLIRCQIRKNLKWSDGSKLTAYDFVRGFQEFLSPENRAFRADLLFPIKNAKKVFTGELKVQELKVRAPKPDQLEIELEHADLEFVYTLSQPVLSPLPQRPLPKIEDLRLKPELWLSSGPYLLSSWDAQKKITLQSNPYFWKSKKRPVVEVILISEDSVALSLYEKGELSFLRRLPSLYVPKYKGRPDYFELDQIRLDYFGFAPKWKSQAQIRKAMAQALAYKDLQNLYRSKGLPGCPGIPDYLMQKVPCHQFQPAEALAQWQTTKEKPLKFEFLYSRQGGDDHKRSAEWMQFEWKKHLNLDVQVNGLENKIFVERLKNHPPDLFRKGIAPDRPTCLSALEIFETNHIENFIQFSDVEFDGLLKKMKLSASDKEKARLCSQGLEILMKEAWIIPTGPQHFTILVKTHWKGWKLNELNQLDLSELERSVN